MVDPAEQRLSDEENVTERLAPREPHLQHPPANGEDEPPHRALHGVPFQLCLMSFCH